MAGSDEREVPQPSDALISHAPAEHRERSPERDDLDYVRTPPVVRGIGRVANLLLLGCISFLPFPTSLVAEHTGGPDARTAMLLYGGTQTACAVAFNLIWRHAGRRLLAPGVSDTFRRDVTNRYLIGLVGYLGATLLALVQPWLTLAATALLALMFILGPSPRAASG